MVTPYDETLRIITDKNHIQVGFKDRLSSEWIEETIGRENLLQMGRLYHTISEISGEALPEEEARYILKALKETGFNNTARKEDLETQSPTSEVLPSPPSNPSEPDHYAARRILGDLNQE